MANELGSVLDALHLDAAERESLANALGVTDTTDTDLFLARLRMLQTVAFQEVVDWLIGRTRYSSVSESDMHRVIELFLTIRKEAPSVDQLVSELAMPAGRATSLLTRMRYGGGKELTSLAMKSSAVRLDKRLKVVQPEGNRKSLWVDGDTLAQIRHVSMIIMQADPQYHNKGQKFQTAQFPEFTSYGREGGVVKTTITMWNHIIAVLQTGGERIT